jgi:hypothetical protein
MKLLLLFFPLSISAFSIRNAIESKLVLSTVLTEINNEFAKDSMILTNLPNTHTLLATDLFSYSAFILSLYLQYSNFMYIEKKLSATSMYSKIQGKTKLAIFVFTIVLTKNIENAI